MHVRRVDPRDQTWEVDRPAYRVHFHDADGASDEHEVSGADVEDVITWAHTQRGERTFVLYAAVAEPDGLGLVRLLGRGPDTAGGHPVGSSAVSEHEGAADRSRRTWRSTVRSPLPGHSSARRGGPPSAALLLAAGAVFIGVTACTGGASSPSASPAAPPGERVATSTGSDAAPAPTDSPSPASPSPLQGAPGASLAPEVPVGAVATTPSGDYAGVPEGTAVAYTIPDLTPPGTVLPAGYALTLDLGQYRLQPVVPGQACSSRAHFNIAGRQWSWASEQGRGQDGVGLVVTGWCPGRGTAAFDDVVQDAGICRFVDEVEPVALIVPGAEQVWAAITTPSTGLDRTYGAARVDDRLVGVEVSGRTAEDQALVASVVRAVTDELVSGGPPTAGGS